MQNRFITAYHVICHTAIYIDSRVKQNYDGEGSLEHETMTDHIPLPPLIYTNTIWCTMLLKNVPPRQLHIKLYVKTNLHYMQYVTHQIIHQSIPIALQYHIRPQHCAQYLITQVRSYTKYSHVSKVIHHTIRNMSYRTVLDHTVYDTMYAHALHETTSKIASKWSTRASSHFF